MLVSTNVLTILSLVAAINGLLTWIGRGFGIHALTLQLIIGYIFYPLTFFLGSYSEGGPGLESPLDGLCLCFPADLTCISSSDTSTQEKLRFFALRA